LTFSFGDNHLEDSGAAVVCGALGEKKKSKFILEEDLGCCESRLGDRN